MFDIDERQTLLTLITHSFTELVPHMNNLRSRPWRATFAVIVVAIATTSLAAAALADNTSSAASTVSPTPAIVAAATVSDTANVVAAAAKRTATSAASTGPAAALRAAPVLVAPSIGPATAQSAVYQNSGVGVVSDIAFTQLVDCGGYSCQLHLDAYIPAGAGPFPTVVLVRGGPSGIGGGGYLEPFASVLASHGILVFNADMRDLASEGGGYPAAFQDVACAVRFARSEASSYGGDPGTVTLVGHSLGGWVGSVVALDATEFQGGCLAGGSGRPDAFVGLSGNYQISNGDNYMDLYNFFGGSPDQTAAARAAGDPFAYATGAPIPVRLVAATGDESVDPANSVALNDFLAQKNWNVSLTLVPDGSHMSILDADSAGLPAVFSAIAAAESNAGAIDPVKASTGG
jgi:acetyl esterase/lipase